MFHVKICGITRTDDARAAAEAGADAIGLNFYEKSPRYIQPAQAAEIACALPAGVLRVGVFVNAAVNHVCRLFDELSLDLVQLHGDEPPELLAQLEGRPCLRAFRIGPQGWSTVTEYLDRCRQLACLPRAVLVDAYDPHQYGGTGQRADWSLLADWRQRLPDMPLVLAGGLKADNVAQAIAAVRPAAVDTASGVEASPGRKDPQQMAAFVREARTALGLHPPCQS